MKTAILIYFSAIVAANFSAFFFGPVSTPFNAFILIGVDMAIRDILHQKIGLIRVLAITFFAAVFSFLINPAGGMIALASVIAFAASGAVDAIVFQKLIHRQWGVKANASNTAGAAVDSVVFPLIAFGGLSVWVVGGQFIAKVIGGFLWTKLLKR